MRFLAFAKIGIFLYRCRSRRLRQAVLAAAARLEGGEFYSMTLREIFRRFHGVEIGLYSHGGCFVPGQFDRHTTIGRYCSIARSAMVLNRNHSMNTVSTHAFFFNPSLGYVSHDREPYTPLAIGNDVWIGHNAVVMPSVKSIGHGAVIGAGAVVCKDVPPYAVVVGNPARVVRYRFAEPQIAQLLRSEWWNDDIAALTTRMDDFQRPLCENAESV